MKQLKYFTVSVFLSLPVGLLAEAESTDHRPQAERSQPSGTSGYDKNYKNYHDPDKANKNRSGHGVPQDCYDKNGHKRVECKDVSDKRRTYK